MTELEWNNKTVEIVAETVVKSLVASMQIKEKREKLLYSYIPYDIFRKWSKQCNDWSFLTVQKDIEQFLPQGVSPKMVEDVKSKVILLLKQKEDAKACMWEIGRVNRA